MLSGLTIIVWIGEGCKIERATVDPWLICIPVPVSHIDSGSTDPRRFMQQRVKTHSPSAEEADSRPRSGLVLCSSSF